MRRSGLCRRADARATTRQLACATTAQACDDDPAFEHDSCGVGFICDIKGRAQPPDHPRREPHQPLHDTPRRCRLRKEHRRRRGHSDGDAVQALRPRRARGARRDTAAARVSMARASSSCRRTRHERAHCKAVFEAEIAAEAQTFIGWRACRSIRRVPTSARPRARRCRTSSSSSSAPASGPTAPRSTRRSSSVSSIMIRKRATHLLRGDRNLRRAQELLRVQPVDEDDRLQGHADAGSGLPVFHGPR